MTPDLSAGATTHLPCLTIIITHGISLFSWYNDNRMLLQHDHTLENDAVQIVGGSKRFL